jgi:hypothetical protein
MLELGHYSLQEPMSLLVYFIPSFVAATRHQDNRFTIFALNLVIGLDGGRVDRRPNMVVNATPEGGRDVVERFCPAFSAVQSLK